MMRITLSGLALTGLVAVPSFTAPQSQGGEERAQKPDAGAKPAIQDAARLDLDLQKAGALSFRVERRSSNPLGSGAGTDTLTKGAAGDRGDAPGSEGSQGNTPGSSQGTGSEHAGSQQAATAKAMLEPQHELRFELRPQRASQQGGQTLIQVDVSKSGARGAGAPGAPGGAGEREDGAVGGQSGAGQGGAGQPAAGQSGAAAGAGEKLASFEILVDEQGRIVRMGHSASGKTTPGEAGQGQGAGEQEGEEGAAQGTTGGASAKPMGAGFGGLDEHELRCDLAIILGSGLHGRPLQQGETYELGDASPTAKTPVEASAPKAGGKGDDSFALRFESTSEGMGGAGGAQPGAGEKAAIFTVLPAGTATSAAGAVGGSSEQGTGAQDRQTPSDRPQDRQPAVATEGTKGTIGRASYSLEDGLVNRFEVRPAVGAAQGGAGMGDDKGKDAATTGGAQKPDAKQPLGKQGDQRMDWITVERVAAR